jgi:hypothetical protein
MIGWLIQKLRIPGLVKPFAYSSEGLTVSVRTSPRYTILTVNGRDLYFIRETGKLDGSGMASDDPVAINAFRAEHIARHKAEA